MSSIVVSNFKTGLETDLEPININNDAFPVLQDAYIERGKVQKKRGTSLLGRLRRPFVSFLLPSTVTIGAGTSTFNIFTALFLQTKAQEGEPDASLHPGSAANPITLVLGAPVSQTWTDATGTGVMTGFSGNITSVTINYVTGVVTVVNSGGAFGASSLTATFSYFPALPVLGLEDFDTKIDTFPQLVAFDTKYSYMFDQNANVFYDTAFFKETGVAFTFKGEDYNQFYSESYENGMFVCNEDPGLHFRRIQTAVSTAATLTITTQGNHGLSDSDYVFINEIRGTTVTNINGVSGQVTITGATTFTLTVTDAVLSGYTAQSGIVQYLTREESVIKGEGGIKFYTGDPVGNLNNGWVNFAPPLSTLQTTDVEYLAAAKTVIAFKDRLLFFDITTITSGNVLVRYPNRMIYSQNGTPYYANFNGTNVSVDANAWFQNEVARGGFLDTPVQEEILVTERNEDIIIVGNQFSFRKLLSTGDDAFPFYYQTIDSEYGGEGTFATITTDRSILTTGNYGLISASSNKVARFDERIPDQIYDISTFENNEKRVTAIREFRDQNVYFTFVSKDRNATSRFPNSTIFYDMKDRSFANFKENYTHYGYFRKTNSYTWATIPPGIQTWADWTDPWNFGGFGERYPSIIAGNQQGFVLQRDIGTGEGHSNQITAIAGNIITSPNHCMDLNDFIVIENAISTLPIPIEVYKITGVTDFDTFTIDTELDPGTYSGGATFYRIPRPVIRSKMFYGFWDAMRKTRVGPSFFLMDRTSTGEITLNIYVDQNPFPSNAPSPGVADYIPYTQKLLTSVEPGLSANLTPSYTWHKMSTSLLGDTFQIEITLDDAQMKDFDKNSEEIVLHAFVLKINPGPSLVI